MWDLVLGLFIFVAGVSGTVTDEHESVSVMEGDSVTLHTNLTEILNGDTILWFFGHRDAFISQIARSEDLTSFLVTDDVGFRDRLHVDQKTGSLTIRNTRTRHSGQYKLTISRKTVTSKIFTVTVSVVAGVMDGLKSVAVSVMEGELITLKPDAEIHKDSLMLWRFGVKGVLLAKVDVEINETTLNRADEMFRDRLELDQTGSLIIKNTKITDSGLYELQIRGHESLQRFFVSVSAPPGLSAAAIMGICFFVLVLAVAAGFFIYRRISKLISQINRQSLTEGDSVTLSTGLTTPGNYKIQWWYEDNLIAKIDSGSRKTFDGADGRFSSKLSLDEKGNLTISNTRNIHSGLYKLKITNIPRKPTNKRFIVTIQGESTEVKEGEAVRLQTDSNTQIQDGDLILWTFGASNLLVIKFDPEIGHPSINDKFTDRLVLDSRTGSLTIKRITNADSGHFKLQIINHQKTTFRRFNVIVTDHQESQSSEPVTVVMPLLVGDVADGANGAARDVVRFNELKLNSDLS